VVDADIDSAFIVYLVFHVRFSIVDDHLEKLGIDIDGFLVNLVR
jgi:hypothetical protein